MQMICERSPFTDKIVGVTFRHPFIELSSDENALSLL
jgi:hypothetical protein